jgi:hypothetical protein
MLCLTDLQRAYDELATKNGWKFREINKILNVKESPENAEWLYYVLKERGFINVEISTFIEECENKTLIKVLKKMKLYTMFSRGGTRIIFVNPDVFVLVALELNPMLYAKAITWLSDNLIYNRIGVGDEGNQLMSRIRQIWNPDTEFYKHVQWALNYIIYNRHETGIRNISGAEDLAQMEKLQNNFAFFIDTGFVKDKEDLLLQLRQEYLKKWQPEDKRIAKTGNSVTSESELPICL